MQPLLEVCNISFREEGNEVFKNISFNQDALQKIVVAGETGTGKSTLLQAISGYSQIYEGQILFDGQKVLGPMEKLLPGHPQIAYLSQQFDLPQFLRVEQALSYANKLSDEEAEALYELCQITHLFKRRTDHASGGERQRIALARLLSGKPKLLLLDEPFSNLDMAHKTILKSIIEDIGNRLKITCMLVSHDPHDTLSWADEIIVLKDGKINQKGTPLDIYRNPVDEYTAALFGDYNLINNELCKSLKRSSEKSKFIRPEEFVLSRDKTGVSGSVIECKFFGSYFKIKINLISNIIEVKSKLGFEKGETVYVSV